MSQLDDLSLNSSENKMVQKFNFWLKSSSLNKYTEVKKFAETIVDVDIDISGNDFKHS